MGARHVLRAGGYFTCCGRQINELEPGHTAGHKMEGRICQECRRALNASPQLVNAVASEMRASGHRMNIKTLRLEPQRRVVPKERPRLRLVK